MTTKTTTQTLILSLSFLLTACGGSDDDLPPISIDDVGDVCEVFVAAYFEAGLECGFVGENDRASFGEMAMRACCVDDGICNEPTIATEESLSRCTDDVAELTCADVDMFTLPASCHNLGAR